MNHQAFLSVSFHQRRYLNAEIEQIIDVLKQFNIEMIDFTMQFRFEAGQDREMMRLACAKIAESDILIAEVSEKAIGVGIEVGYAAALGKTIIYLRRANAEYSTTVGGLATEIIVYQNVIDLGRQLTEYLDAC